MESQSLLLESENLRLKKCRHGFMAYLTTDKYIGRSLDYYGEFSEGEVEVFRQLVRPGNVVVEIGANHGAHTVILAKLVGPQGRVYAFEPQRVIFQILCANVALNALGNVFTHHAAVGRELGNITVPRLDYSQPQNFGGLSLGGGKAGETVALLTIDSLKLDACDLIKVDVEGMEGEVLAGCERTIGQFRPALYLENDRQDKSAALIRQLFALDYRLYWHLPPLFSSRNYFGNSENLFGQILSVNMMGLHRSRPQKVALREITAPEANWRLPGT